MSKPRITPISKRQSSTEHSNPISTAKTGRNDKQTNYLMALKDKGKKGLIKFIPKPMNFIKNLVQKGAVSIKKEINSKLLPTLTIKNMHNQIFQKIIPESSIRFQQMNMEITHSMLFFQQNLQGEEGEAELLKLQTQKCFKHIPPQYFQPQLQDLLQRMLTRDRQRSIELGYQLGDYLDEVEFNVNQQVAYKMKVFMTFVNFLTTIGNLADLSLKKIAVTRVNNNILKEIVVQRSSRVNTLRQKKEEMEGVLYLLDRLKSLKKLENYFMSSVNTKGKIFMTENYKEYCKIHEQLKDYCCTRNLCKFWDVAYYIERGYQDSFSRSLKNYLTEIIILDDKKIMDIMQPNKQEYETAKVGFSNFSDVNLDESYQVDEEDIELVNKHNIEKEIISIFKQGLKKCSYSTDEICQEISKGIKACFNKMFLLLKGKASILTSPDVTKQERKALLDKVLLSKYIKIVEVWSQRMKKVIKRQVSIVEKGLIVASELKEEFPEKYEIISSYLMQIIYISFEQIDESIESLMMSREIKKQDNESIRQILNCSNSWKEMLLEFKIYPHLLLHLKANTNTPQHSTSHNQLFTNLMKKFEQTRKTKVEQMLNGYNHSTIEQLPLRLQQDEWKPVNIPNQFYHVLGEVVYGNRFIKHHENLERKMLSSSLILERNPSLMMSNNAVQKQKEGKKEENGNSIESMEYDLQMSENVITLEGESFRILSSTMGAVGFLNGYLQWVQELGLQESLESTILCKIMQFSIMYIKIVQDLIIKKEALKYGNIKSKSITGKHLLLTYSQLKFYRLVIQNIFKRFSKFISFASIITDHINKLMLSISKKFKAILELAIRESIDKIVVDPRKQIKGPVNETIQIVSALTKSADLVKDILMSVKQLGEFIGVSWCSIYLQKIKTLYKSVYRSIMNSNGTRKSKDIDWSDNIYWKFKELEYVMQNLQEYKEYLVGFDGIVAELQNERKKLERPE